MKAYQFSQSYQGDAFRLFSFFRDRPHAFFLDSSLHRRNSQFSYIGFSPIDVVDNLTDLKRIFKKHQLTSKLNFPAGAVGYLGYDGPVHFGIYDTIMAVDHRQKRLIISSLSKGRIKDILREIQPCQHRVLTMSTPGVAEVADLHSNFTKEEYIQAVRQALEHIRRGDIYQINLSHQLKLKLPNWQKYASSLDIYGHLRQAFPSEFGAYFDDGKQVILSASPERFLKLEKGLVQVKPMKGTRPRGETKAQDRRLKEELLKSQKEKAELLMVTDLERNDLGRVCEYSSVRVKAMRSIESYSSVFQATSTIEGRLRRNCDQFDLLQATFPSGSVTGCPKIEAMKIISDLERGSRGLYTGALGYMSFSGDLDFNVMIRTMFLRKDQITFHVGGGIVADSKPEDEWQETWDKAKPLIETLEKSFQ